MKKLISIPDLLSEEQINIIAIGNILLDITKDYCRRVSNELIAPIAKMIKDPDFLARHKPWIEENVPNWAEYKKSQRNYNILVAHETLRLKRQQERLRNNYLKYIAALIPRRGRPSNTIQTYKTDYVSEIATFLSPKTKAKIDLKIAFNHARDLPITLKYPWSTILSSIIKEPITFNALPEIHTESTKSDIVAKLQTLLQMETDGQITITQTEPFGEISISPQEIEPNGEVIIKQRDGTTKICNWNNLSDEQRTDLIANIETNKIMCVGV